LVVGVISLEDGSKLLAFAGIGIEHVGRGKGAGVDGGLDMGALRVVVAEVDRCAGSADYAEYRQGKDYRDCTARVPREGTDSVSYDFIHGVVFAAVRPRYALIGIRCLKAHLCSM
jgi:hypothetical protein